jgi:hypothetical protein
MGTVPKVGTTSGEEFVIAIPPSPRFAAISA